MNQQYIDFLRAKSKYEQNSFSRFKKNKKGKPQCVFCKRSVGMTFEIKENGTVYIAKCGDKKKPCNQTIRTRIPKYINVQKRKDELNEELNELVAELKNFRVRVIYTDVVEKTDVDRFEYLKNEIAKRVRELTILRNQTPTYPSNINNVDIIPDITPGDYESHNRHMNKYLENSHQLESFIIYKYPERISITKGELVVPTEADERGNKEKLTPTLVSQNDLFVVEQTKNEDNDE
jgi:hypothetical protein